MCKPGRRKRRSKNELVLMVYRIRRIGMGADVWTSWYFNIEEERFAIYTEKRRENRIGENMRG